MLSKHLTIRIKTIPNKTMKELGGAPFEMKRCLTSGNATEYKKDETKKRKKNRIRKTTKYVILQRKILTKQNGNLAV